MNNYMHTYYMQLILDFDEFDTFYEFINKIRTIKVNEEN